VCPILCVLCKGWDTERSPLLNSNRHEVLKPWIAAILWLILIAIESSALLSANNTSRILYPLLHFLFGIDWERFETWHFFIRKSGHVVGYGILSVLLFRAFRATLPAMSEDFRRAADLIWRGELSFRFWIGVVLIGTIVPLILLGTTLRAGAGGASAAGGAAMLALAGLWTFENLWIEAGQAVPLS